jgi:hypothetical protein
VLGVATCLAQTADEPFFHPPFSNDSTNQLFVKLWLPQNSETR